MNAGLVPPAASLIVVYKDPCSKPEEIDENKKDRGKVIIPSSFFPLRKKKKQAREIILDGESTVPCGNKMTFSPERPTTESVRLVTSNLSPQIPRINICSRDHVDLKANPGPDLHRRAQVVPQHTVKPQKTRRKL
jgi:hypothetical protein